MELCDWLMVSLRRMVVWSSATVGYGVQCVIILGTTMMQQWCADNWAIAQSVSSMLKNVKQMKFLYIGVGQGGAWWPVQVY